MGTGARFSKVPIINEPGMLSPFTLTDRGFNSFASNMIKLSVNESKWSSLPTRTRALILYMDQFMFLGNRARFLITVPVLLDRARH